MPKILSRTTICFAEHELSAVTLVSQGFPAAEVEKAIADVDRARDRGFLYCLAVFVSGEYDGLWERAAENDGHLDWGRGQDVTKRNFFRDGKLVPDPEWKPDPPVAKWTAHGLTCSVRENGMGYLCGYVAVPKDHPWHGKGYGQCTEAEPCDESYCDHRIEHIVDVHGGVTFAGAMYDDIWWIGFDCAHLGDAPSPEQRARDARERGLGGAYHPGDHYWTVGEVRAETERMAEQVAAASVVG